MDQGDVLDAFSPRQVQASIRAGACVDDVVAETGWPLDKVLRYAEPVLGERAYVVARAQAVELRRSGSGTSLLETVLAVLGLDDADPSLAWDAHRREDGRWVVTAGHDGILASWTYDSTGNSVHPLDDPARAWMGIAPLVDPIEDALGLIADTPVVRADAEVETIEPERPRLVAVPSIHEEPELELLPASSEQTVIIALDDAAGVNPATDPRPEPEAKPKKTRARRTRASVPSWDEILFGTPKGDDTP